MTFNRIVVLTSGCFYKALNFKKEENPLIKWHNDYENTESPELRIPYPSVTVLPECGAWTIDWN